MDFILTATIRAIKQNDCLFHCLPVRVSLSYGLRSKYFALRRSDINYISLKLSKLVFIQYCWQKKKNDEANYHSCRWSCGWTETSSLQTNPAMNKDWVLSFPFVFWVKVASDGSMAVDQIVIRSGGNQTTIRWFNMFLDVLCDDACYFFISFHSAPSASSQATDQSEFRWFHFFLKNQWRRLSNIPDFGTFKQGRTRLNKHAGKLW